MENRAHVLAVDALLASLDEMRSRVLADIEAGLSHGARLRDAVRAVADSSAGSWAGWHSRMYYGDFREPSVAESWDSEWGGINSYSNRWRERSQAEVQEAVEARADATLSDLAATADRVREACQPLQREVLTILSPICDLAGLEKEAKLLQKLEAVDWIVSPANFIQAMAPRQVVSRDSMAMSQGLQAPLHLNVEAAVVSNTMTLAVSRDFLDDSIRLARQVRTKLEATPAVVRTAATVAGDPDERLSRQLRRRSVALFILAALGVVAISVYTVRTFVSHAVGTAIVVVVAAVVVGGLYALLVDRMHARRILVAAGTIASAIAAVDQVIGRI